MIGEGFEMDAAELESVINPKQVSENFSVAKLLSILLVATGHFFDDSILWVPVSIALFVFAFSSGYFSAERYVGKVALRAFWLGKIRRLMPPLMMVNVFLLGLFICQGKRNIFHIQTLVAWFGMNSALDWFGIHNQSPFGAGLWFFTVLLIFYGVYPLFNRWCATPSKAKLFVVIFAIFCIVGQIFASPPYMLWLTVFGFGFGVFAKRVTWSPSRLTTWLFTLGFGTSFVVANYCGYKDFNLVFIAILSICTAGLLLNNSLKITAIGWLRFWIPCVFEIYFLHTYLFVKTDTLHPAVSYLLSMILILVCALGIYKLRTVMARKLSFPVRAG